MRIAEFQKHAWWGLGVCSGSNVLAQEVLFEQTGPGAVRRAEVNTMLLIEGTTLCQEIKKPESSRGPVYFDSSAGHRDLLVRRGKQIESRRLTALRRLGGTGSFVFLHGFESYCR